MSCHDKKKNKSSTFEIKNRMVSCHHNNLLHKIVFPLTISVGLFQNILHDQITVECHLLIIRSYVSKHLNSEAHNGIGKKNNYPNTNITVKLKIIPISKRGQ